MSGTEKYERRNILFCGACHLWAAYVYGNCAAGAALWAAPQAKLLVHRGLLCHRGGLLYGVLLACVACGKHAAAGCFTGRARAADACRLWRHLLAYQSAALAHAVRLRTDGAVSECGVCHGACAGAKLFLISTNKVDLFWAVCSHAGGHAAYCAAGVSFRTSSLGAEGRGACLLEMALARSGAVQCGVPYQILQWKF